MNKPLSQEELLRLRDTAEAMRQDAKINEEQLKIAERILSGQIPLSQVREAYNAVV